MNILHLDSSPFIEQSVSRQLTAFAVSTLKRAHPNATVTYRDLGTNPPAHLSAGAMNALHNHAQEEPGEAIKAELAQIYQSIDELPRCDVLVMGVPMYNHSIPSTLKAWLDQVCQAGKTFRYTAEGPVGLLRNKPVIIASSRGGIYSIGEAVREDFQEPYLTSILSFLGLKDLHIVRAEGVSLSSVSRHDTISQAQSRIETLCTARIFSRETQAA